MTTISYTFKPKLERFSKVFGKMDFKSFLRKETEKLAFNTERFGKQLTPVGTPESTGVKGYVGGRLRASIGVSTLIGGLVGHMVSTNTEYAIYVHEGTKYMRARPFLSEGLDFAQQNLKNQIGSRLDKEITDKFKKL